MTLIEQYTKLSENLIKNDNELQLYERKLNLEYIYVNHLIASSRLIDLLIHPVRLVRSNIKAKKVASYIKEYNVLKKSDIGNFIDWKNADEFGSDLDKAARVYKINKLKEFARSHKIDEKNNNKKLLKVRK